MRSLLIAIDMVVLMGMSLTSPFVGALLFCWISFMNPHQLTWGFASGMPWALLAFFATIIGCLVTREPKRLPITGVTVAITAFLVGITITTATSMGAFDQTFQKYLLVFKSFLFLLITISLLTTRRRIHALIWLMVISVGFFGAKGAVFEILHGGGAHLYGPPATMISDNNQLAVGLLVCLPLMNFLRLQSPHRWVRLGLAVLMGLTLIAVLGSYSRGALVALAAVAVYFWLKSRRKLVIGVLMFGVIAGGIAFMPRAWVARMYTIETYQKDGSFEGRSRMWHTAWLLAKLRPLTGAGMTGTYQRAVVDRVDPQSAARAVHSIWFECLAENGFPTFFIWFSITAAGALAAGRIIRRTRDHPELAWCGDLARMSQVSMIAYLVGGTLLSLSYWDYFYYVIGVVTATDLHVRRALADPRAAMALAPWKRKGMLISRPVPAQ